MFLSIRRPHPTSYGVNSPMAIGILPTKKGGQTAFVRGLSFEKRLLVGWADGSGSTSKSWGCAGFGPCFHLPGQPIWNSGFLSHSQISLEDQPEASSCSTCLKKRGEKRRAQKNKTNNNHIVIIIILIIKHWPCLGWCSRRSLGSWDREQKSEKNGPPVSWCTWLLFGQGHLHVATS